MSIAIRTWLLAVASLLPTTTAWACPSCPVGKLARQQVCESGFGVNMLSVLLPFVAIGLVCMWVEQRGRQRAQKSVS
jgi:hypothetical protein